MDYESQPESQLLSLPTELIENIVIRASEDSVRDTRNIKLCCKQLGMSTREETFYRRIDILNISYNLDWMSNDTHPSLFHTCYRANNPGVLYPKGLQDFFINEKQTEGLELIRRAADGGCETAIYTHILLPIALSGFPVELGFPNMSPAFATRIRRRISELHYQGWCPMGPHEVLRKYEHRYLTRLWRCPCSHFVGWGGRDNDQLLPTELCISCFWVTEVREFARNLPGTCQEPAKNHKDMA